MKTMLTYVYSLAWIFACLLLGRGLQELIEVPIPGSIFGMLFLFVALSTGLCKAQWQKPGCELFMKNMLLLFIPVSTGVMVHADLLGQQAIPILASTVGGSFVVLVLLAKLIDHWVRHNDAEGQQR